MGGVEALRCRWGTGNGGHQYQAISSEVRVCLTVSESRRFQAGQMDRQLLLPMGRLEGNYGILAGSAVQDPRGALGRNWVDGCAGLESVI